MIRQRQEERSWFVQRQSLSNSEDRAVDANPSTYPAAAALSMHDNDSASPVREDQDLEDTKRLSHRSSATAGA